MFQIKGPRLGLVRAQLPVPPREPRVQRIDLREQAVPRRPQRRAPGSKVRLRLHRGQDVRTQLAPALHQRRYMLHVAAGPACEHARRAARASAGAAVDGAGEAHLRLLLAYILRPAVSSERGE